MYVTMSKSALALSPKYYMFRFDHMEAQIMNLDQAVPK